MTTTLSRYVLLTLLMSLTPFAAQANEWVVGTVKIVEDYRSFEAALGMLVTLEDPHGYGGAAVPAACTQRFRIVVGSESVTQDTQKTFFALLLTARATGDRVRLLVNPANHIDGYCPVRIVSLGDV